MASATVDMGRHFAAFSKRRLSLAEWYVLSIPGQWPVPKDELPQIAASQSIDDSRGAVCLPSCEYALDRLMGRGWLRIIRRPDLAELRSTVLALHCGEPVYGYPRVGDVDFTKTGAREFRALSDELYGRHFFSEAVVDRRSGKTVYTLLKKRTDEIVSEARKHCEYAVLSISQIHPWCIYWWKVFPKGWRIELSVNLSGRNGASRVK